MVLKVVSSSLTIYPYMWQIEKLPKQNKQILQQIYIYQQLLNSFWLRTVGQTVTKSQFLKHILLTTNTNKMMFKTNYNYQTFKPQHTAIKTQISTTLPHNLFSLYTTLLTQSTTSTLRVHPSHKNTFLLNSKLNTRVFNLTKLKKRWLDIYQLLHNLFFYKVPLLAFATPLFKQEILSLNWSINSKLRQIWTYVSNSLHLSRNKIMQSEFLIFNYLSQKGFKVAFIFDTLYHKNTNFILHKNNFYTLGLVPVQSNLYNVNFAIPVSNDSVFLHLFFIRLVLHIRKNTNVSYYKALQKTWLSISTL